MSGGSAFEPDTMTAPESSNAGGSHAVAGPRVPPGDVLQEVMAQLERMNVLQQQMQEELKLANADRQRLAASLALLTSSRVNPHAALAQVAAPQAATAATAAAPLSPNPVSAGHLDGITSLSASADVRTAAASLGHCTILPSHAQPVIKGAPNAANHIQSSLRTAMATMYAHMQQEALAESYESPETFREFCRLCVEHYLGLKDGTMVRAWVTFEDICLKYCNDLPWSNVQEYIRLCFQDDARPASSWKLSQCVPHPLHYPAMFRDTSAQKPRRKARRRQRGKRNQPAKA